MRKRLSSNEPICIKRKASTGRCIEWGLGRTQTSLGPRGLGGTIRGTFCERKVAAKKRFDRRSFRWKKSGKAWILIGCPKGSWKAKVQSCAVGTRAYAILSPTSGSCASHERRITKG
jgi:hypothetical protein